MNGLEEIKLIVDNHFDCDSATDSHKVTYVRARKVVTFLALKVTPFNDVDIANLLDIDRTTVYSYYKKDNHETDYVKSIVNKLLPECEYIRNYYLYEYEESVEQKVKRIVGKIDLALSKHNEPRIVGKKDRRKLSKFIKSKVGELQKIIEDETKDGNSS